MALTKIDDRGLKTPIDLLDTERIRIGTGNDLQLYHESGVNYIQTQNSTNLEIYSGSDKSIKTIVDGAVELYHNNSKKFETTDVGVLATGHIFSTTKFRGNDDVKVSLGTSEDLQIYHSSDVSRIRNTNDSGTLKIQATSNGENAINIVPNGTVELYYDGTKKLETASDKINFYAHAKVNADNTYDLGASGARWKDLYISNDIDIIDNGKLLLGTGDDLQIYHDGTHSRIVDTGTNATSFQTDELRIHDESANENLAKFIANGAVELYYDNSRKVYTYSSGVGVDGTLWIPDGSASGNRISIGDSADLLIYHDGSNSYIKEAGTGQLMIQADNLILENAAGANYLVGMSGAEVILYHNDAPKFQTTSGGISVTGNLDCDGIRMVDNHEIRLGTGDDLKLWHNGTNSFVHHDNGSGWLYLQGDAIGLRTKSDNNETYLTCSHNGGVELRYNDSKKLETTANGVDITGSLWTDGIYMDDNHKIHVGTSGTDLQIYHDGSSSYISNNTGNLYIEGKSGQTAIQIIPDGATDLRYSGAKKFETQTNGVTVFGSEGLKLYTENGNNANTNSIVWRAGSNSQQANVAQIIARQTSDWGGHLFIKVKKNDGGLSDNYATVLNAKGESNGFVELCTDSSARLQVQSTGFKAGATIPGDHATGGLIINSSGESSLYRSNDGIAFIIGGPQSGQKLVEFRHVSTGIGNISKNGTTAITFNTTNSDRTLKKNFEDWTDSYWTGFKDLKPQKFNFLFQEDSDPKLKGYIAQDLASTFPEAYPKDAETDKYMFNPSGMVPYLMKTLQEAIVEIETLKTKVAALESS